jgi:uncharacterized repeat protein (TIGR01451 family)
MKANYFLIIILFFLGKSTFVQGQTMTLGCEVTKEITCHNGSDGEVILAIMGGFSPYLITWSNGGTQPIMSNLSSGIYKVTVVDATNQKATLQIAVSNPPAIELVMSSTKSICGQNTGIATVLATNGEAPYTYKWSTGATTQTITNLTASTYYCTVTDAKGCTAVNNIYVNFDLDFDLTTSNTGLCSKNDAIISITNVTGGTAPYKYAIYNPNGNGYITPTIQNQPTGSFAVIVSNKDSTCWTSKTIFAYSSSPTLAPIEPIYPYCDNTDPHGLRVYHLGISKPYTLEATNTTTNKTVTSGMKDSLINSYVYNYALIPVPDSGKYRVILKGANGCADTSYVLYNLPKFLNAKINICGNSVLAIANGGIPPYSYVWTNVTNGALMSQQALFSNAPAGKYILNLYGSSCVYRDTIIIDGITCNTKSLLPKVFCDENKNCQYDTGEPLLKDFILEVQPLKSYLTSSVTGTTIPVDFGAYGVKVKVPNNYWKACQDSVITTIQLASADTTVLWFPLQKTVLCPKLEIDISTNRLRPCLTSIYDVKVCNKGTLTTNGVSYVDVNFDNWLGFESCALVSQPINATTRRFFIDKQLAMGECFSFSIVVKTACDATVGWTQCVKAHVYPDSICAAPAAWSGARIELETECVGDSVCFKIKNTGTAPTSLNKNLKYQIVEDNIILKQGIFNLNPNQIQNIKLPATGKTYRLFADQEPNYPVLSLPTVALEGCKSNVTQPVSLGFVTQFPNGDAEPFISEHCQVIVNSFDPNDKQGFPTGVNNERFIEPNQDIEYQIRFQNTGTAEAIDVTLRDELSSLLDIQNLRMGASSHPYTWEVSGKGILTVKFKNINLPAKIIDEAKSNGFVKFRIPQQRDLKNFTQINNQAGIYFDNNTPVITNTTLHTVCKNCLQFLPTRDLATDILVKIYPNPFQDNTTIELIDAPLGNYQFELYDILGRPIMTQNIDNQRFNFERNNLDAGIYFYKITDGKKTVGKGKMIAQ